MADEEIDWGKWMLKLSTVMTITLAGACYLARHHDIIEAPALVIWFWLFLYPAGYIMWNEVKKIGER